MSAVLDRPLKVGSLTAKNRLGLSPMCTNFCDAQGQVTDRLVSYYEARAAGGAGLIIVENAAVDRGTGRGNPGMLLADSAAMIPGLNLLAEAINRHRAISILQINHMGAQADPELAESQLVAPSALAWSNSPHPPRSLESNEIESVIESFVSAANIAVRAGFDGIEVHAAHGYLLSEFISPYANLRDDTYGGSETNRLRILVEVLERVREQVGPNKIVGIRLNGDDYLGDRGIRSEDSVRIAQAAQRAGVDYVDVSAGFGESVPCMIQPIYVPHATNVHLARAIKAAVTVPVFAVGSITEQAMAEDVLSNGSADLVLLGRGLIADPNLPQRWLANDNTSRRRCIRCNDGCIQRIFEKKSITCTINPLVGHEVDWNPHGHPAERPLSVLVAGGGPAGLEAARVAAARGHRVTLCEREPLLGGQVRSAGLLSFKRELRALIPYYESVLENLEVDVRLSTEVGPRLASDVQAEHVIVAVGAESFTPCIPGIETCLPAALAHGDTEPMGNRVIVMGGGLVGCELALDLGRKGHKVTVVELLPDVLRGVNVTSRMGLLAALTDAHVDVLTAAETQRIEDTGLILRQSGGSEIELEADSIIVAAGFLPRRELAEELAEIGIPSTSVGDCLAPRNILAAIHEGFHAARCL